MIFLETSFFSKVIQSLLSDDEYHDLQAALMENPARGDLIPGGAGLRKLRWARRSSGKSGGLRAIYYWAVAQDQILMVFAYPKSKMENLTDRQLAELAKVAKEEFGNG
ncbi:MAG: type II toxin-antitoxin system RelE/ParE family toxin [Pseudomonadota bacterium]